MSEQGLRRRAELADYGILLEIQPIVRSRGRVGNLFIYLMELDTTQPVYREVTLLNTDSNLSVAGCQEHVESARVTSQTLIHALATYGDKGSRSLEGRKYNNVAQYMFSAVFLRYNIGVLRNLVLCLGIWEFSTFSLLILELLEVVFTINKVHNITEQ